MKPQIWVWWFAFRWATQMKYWIISHTAEAMFSWLGYSGLCVWTCALLHTDHSGSQVFAHLNINNFIHKQLTYILLSAWRDKTGLNTDISVQCSRNTSNTHLAILWHSYKSTSTVTIRNYLLLMASVQHNLSLFSIEILLSQTHSFVFFPLFCSAAVDGSQHFSRVSQYKV